MGTDAVTNSTGISTDAVEVLEDEVVSSALGTKKEDETLEDLVFGQVGANAAAAEDSNEQAQKKSHELRTLAQSRNNEFYVDVDGNAETTEDGRYVRLTVDNRFLRPDRLVVSEFGLAGTDAATVAKRDALHAQWEAAQKARAEGGVPAYPDLPAAATPAAAPEEELAPEDPKMVEQRKANAAVLDAAAPAKDHTFTDPNHKLKANGRHEADNSKHADGDDKKPSTVEKDGRLEFAEGLPEDQRDAAYKSAAYQRARAMGLSDDAAQVYLRDVEVGADDPQGRLDQVNNDYADYQAYMAAKGSRDAGDNPMARYKTPRAYADSRASGASESRMARYKKDFPSLESRFPNKKDQWAAVMGDGKATGDEYIKQLFGSGAVSWKITDDDMEAAATAVAGAYPTDGDRARAMDAANKYLTERYASYSDLDGPMKFSETSYDEAEKALQAEIDTINTDAYHQAHPKWEEDLASHTAQLERLKKSRQDIYDEVHSAINNPAELQHLLGRDNYKATKQQKAAGRKVANGEDGSSAYAQTKRTFKEGKQWLTDGRAVFGDVKGIADDIIGILEKPLAALKEGINALLTKQDEYVKASNRDDSKNVAAMKFTAPKKSAAATAMEQSALSVGTSSLGIDQTHAQAVAQLHATQASGGSNMQRAREAKARDKAVSNDPDVPGADLFGQA